jgi:endonuclease/exonuclease/phosphatase family metal-dependent hydrolase
MRLLTWNIHSGIGPDRRYDLDRIIALIRRHDPDIVALQEVDSRGHPHDALPLNLLKKVLGSHAAEARTIIAPDGHYGHALISRWPLEDVNLHDISVSRQEPRGVIEAAVRTPHGLVDIVATHLGLRPAEQRRQIRILAAIAERLTEPPKPIHNLVMLGDFNDWNGQVRRMLQRWLPGRTVHKTFPARRPIFKLDRIFCRSSEVLLRSWTDRAGCLASDHLPVVADVALPAPNMAASIERMEAAPAGGLPTEGGVVESGEPLGPEAGGSWDGPRPTSSSHSE